MRALLDTNVVCDWLLGREPWRADAQTIAESIAKGRLDCVIAATTVTNLFYVARRIVGREAALALVSRCLNSFEVWPVDHRVLQEAVKLSGRDFEDNVQVAVAHSAASTCIVTRDPKGFLHALLPVKSPSEFVIQLRASPP
jgi:predicted nucleic acid-binding protein